MGDAKPEDPPNQDSDLIRKRVARPDPESLSVARPSETETETETGRDMTISPNSLSSNPSWFTPKKLLLIFCMINLINYIDRGAIASNGVNGSRRSCKDGKCTSGSGIQGAFNLNNFEDGVLSSAFMVGLLVASPIFAVSAKSFNPFRLIGIGLTVWTLAVAFCGISFNFWSITIGRMLVGVGEASFISLAAPFIDDNAPASRRTAWLGAFYMCIPTGVAVGYVYGGVISHVGWRWAFWVEALLMLPFAILGFVMKPLQLKGLTPKTAPMTTVEKGSELQGDDRGEPSRSKEVPSECSKPLRQNVLKVFGRDMKALLQEKVFLVNVLGYIAYNFVIGSYSYWGPKAGYNIYNMSNADYMFGGVTAVCGVLGTVAGGFLLDYVSSTIPNAFKLLSLATLAGAVFCFAAFCLKSMYAFLALFAIGELLVFATQAPVNFVCLHCVKPSLRPLSMAISTVSIHIFGDVPSTPLVGLLQDKIHNWRSTALILTSIFFLAAGIWFIGIFLRSVDRYNEEGEEAVAVVERLHSTPLLAEKKVPTT